MKEIKIKFVGFPPNFDIYRNVFCDILVKYYKLKYSNQPDYVFFSLSGYPFEHTNYKDAIRIFVAWEPFTPDFNTVDYAMGYDNLTFGDRYFRAPVYFEYPQYLVLAQHKHERAEQLFKEKTDFCDFIYGHSEQRPYRKEILQELSQYKTLTCAGKWNHNVSPSQIVTREKGKFETQKKCKFSIAFDSVEFPFFTTEKIVDAFAAGTVPVYYGDPHIKEIFNEKAFINVSDFNYDIKRVCEKIIQIDQDDKAYLEMLKVPTFVQEDYAENEMKRLEKFICNIFDQPKEKAFRRFRLLNGPLGEDQLREYNALWKSHAPFHELYRRNKLNWYFDFIEVLKQIKKNS